MTRQALNLALGHNGGSSSFTSCTFATMLGLLWFLDSLLESRTFRFEPLPLGLEQGLPLGRIEQ